MRKTTKLVYTKNAAKVFLPKIFLKRGNEAFVNCLKTINHCLKAVFQFNIYVNKSCKGNLINDKQKHR